LLAIHTAGKQLRLYRVAIDWQLSSSKEQIPSLPRINFLHLETIDEFNPQLEEKDVQSDIYLLPVLEAQLSHLELLPPGVDYIKKEPFVPTLFAVFSHLPNQYSGNVAGEPYSILSRWELRTRSSTLHSGFSTLTSKKTGSTTPLKVSLVLSFAVITSIIPTLTKLIG
jgi:hypothetical protein